MNFKFFFAINRKNLKSAKSNASNNSVNENHGTDSWTNVRINFKI